MKKYNYLILFFLATFALLSCNKLLDVNPEEVIQKDNYLGKDKLDARSALFGVLAQMQDFGKQYIMLGEARADLLSSTSYTSDDLRQIEEHSETKDNPYVSVSTLYSIINNCNIGLHGIDSSANVGSTTNRVGLLPEYFAILRVRTWAFLQVAINYGKVPFITAPVASTSDLSRQYPLLSFDQALDSLINQLLPLMTTPEVSYSSSLGYSIPSLIPNKNYLLGELYLWKGDYVSAATYFKAILDNGSTTTYKLTYNISFSSTGITFGDDEQITKIGYSSQYKQPNPLVDWYVSYQSKPSDLAINNWNQSRLTNTYTTRDTSDVRGKGYAWDYYSGYPMVKKYMNQSGSIVLLRASNVHLRLAEAINRAGFPLHALAIINTGAKNDAGANKAHFTGNAEPFLNFDQAQYAAVNGSGGYVGTAGIRGRYNLLPVTVPVSISFEDSIAAVEKLILNEGALEYAYEGLRWQDLLRIAKRTDNPSILADAIAKKFLFENSSLTESIRAKLMDKNNWYLPLPELNNFLPVEKNVQ